MLLTDFLKHSARKYPENIAVKDKNLEISYTQLDALSDRLASCLIAQKVQIGDRVGIYLDRSIEAIIAIFGILKTGGVYVPIDITFPPERKLYIISNCSIEILITDLKKITLFEEALETKSPLKSILLMDNSLNEYSRIPKGDKEIINFYQTQSVKPFQKILSLSDESLANILYTSGSTGKPKGVMMSHRALSASMQSQLEYIGANAHDRMSSTVPMHFSMSPFEIFVSTGSGATLSIIPPGLFAFPDSLTSFIESEKLTIWHSVPSIITQMVLYGELQKRDLSSLRLLHLAGGVIPIEHLRQFMRIFPHICCCNIYGSAETYEIASYHIKNLPESVTSIPVGKPWPGVELFIVDALGKFVEKKEGAVGELYVHTPFLMKGYWSKEKGANQITPSKSPFHFLQKGIKLYRTGDIAKIDKDGNYVLIGRADNTINKEGYRIGLNEIEAVLFSCSEVKEAAVVTEGRFQNKKVKAVVALREGSGFLEKDIKGLCRKKLPRYMVPDKIEFRNFLPKTSTGKVDKKEL